MEEAMMSDMAARMWSMFVVLKLQRGVAADAL
jgi:hypothetical protein